MAIVKKALYSLLPDISFGAYLNALFDAIAASAETLREYLQETIAESNPSTADETLDEWRSALEVDDALGNDALVGTYASTGGQSYSYLHEQLQSEYPNIVLTVTGVFAYTISGYVNTSSDFLRVQALVDRLFPLYDVCTYNVTTLSGSSVARCGLGITGAAITGNLEEDQ
ncbi:MAG: hypothetical protein PQJ59_01855 [Spirochaetales bacterium]|nr:hypothetical protein [Spirochaetales bacterium]